MTPVARVHRVILGGATFFGAMALIAGCSSAASSSPSSPTASSSPSASSAPVGTPAAVSTSSPAAPAGTVAPTPTSSHSASPEPSSSAASTPSCATSGLQVTLGLAEGAAGSVYQVLDFTNISGGPCTLFGFPGVSLAGGTPVTQIGAAASRTTGTAVTLVTLSAGGTANALLRITDAGNYSPSTCKPVASTYLQIYPPNQFTPVYLAYKSTGCSSSKVNLLSIGVMQAGSGG